MGYTKGLCWLCTFTFRVNRTQCANLQVARPFAPYGIYPAMHSNLVDWHANGRLDTRRPNQLYALDGNVRNLLLLMRRRSAPHLSA